MCRAWRFPSILFANSRLTSVIYIHEIQHDSWLLSVISPREFTTVKRNAPLPQERSTCNHAKCSRLAQAGWVGGGGRLCVVLQVQGYRQRNSHTYTSLQARSEPLNVTIVAFTLMPQRLRLRWWWWWSCRMMVIMYDHRANDHSAWPTGSMRIFSPFFFA